MAADQASQVIQRFQLMEQAATEQLNARRTAELALVEAQTRITQQDKWLILVFSGGQTNGTEERKHGPIGAS